MTFEKKTYVNTISGSKNISLLADFFGNFRNIRLKLYKFHLAHFISAPGLARQAALKKKVNL